ncbi:hypothetical protein [Lentilactobacillus senioris]|uniref:hypothetical protein n=1 Tax=Lentilactobacillus senioris TaxID=931534 RepID=UPI0006D037EE|nr:hypothetical protein [Lentilactobacillus senioris]
MFPIKSFFINALTINDLNPDNFHPITIDNKNDRLTFSGILTSNLQNIYIGDKELIFGKDNKLFVQLNLIQNVSTSNDEYKYKSYPLDKKEALISEMPQFSEPVKFTVELNPFRDNIIYSFDLSKPLVNYYFNIECSIEINNNLTTDNFFSFDFLVKIKLEDGK